MLKACYPHDKRSKKLLSILLFGLTGLRLAVAASVPLTPDETYYWVWSKNLQAGYLDHPPMVALFIWLGTHFAGNGAIGIRLLAPPVALLGSILLYQAAEDLKPGTGPAAVLLLNATLMFGVGAVTMTPDTPLLFFWTACLWAMARLLRTGRAAWWVAAGLAAGLAMASKYTAILLPVGIGLWLLLPGQRFRLASPMPWLGATVAGLAVAPVLWWNANHDWASLAKQGGRSFVWHPLKALSYLAELLGGQIGLATPLIFLLCLAGIWTCWRQARSGEPGLVTALTLPPILLFVQHAMGDRVQANWPAIIYPAAVLGAARLGGRWKRLLKPALTLGAAITAIVYIQVVFHPVSFGTSDPLARFEGWPGFTHEVAERVAAGHAGFVASDNYGTAAMLAYAQLDVPVLGAEPRWQFFDLPPAPASLTDRRGLFIRPASHTGPPPGWTSVTALPDLRRGQYVYTVFSVSGGTAVLLPRR